MNWDEAAELYRIVPLGTPSATELKIIYGNCRFACFSYYAGELVAAGRALADGADCAYLSGVVVHPRHQGQGLGRQPGFWRETARSRTRPMVAATFTLPHAAVIRGTACYGLDRHFG